jgi:hypothetical protein
MAYQEISVSSVTEIPAAANAFMAANGISVPFTLSAAIGGTNNQDKDVIATHANGNRAFCRSPKLNGSQNNPFVPAPTKIHCFGGTSPVHWCAVVIEFGYNLYRHLYLGHMEKLGDYTGGEVVAATNFPDAQSSQNFTIGYDDAQYLFNAAQNYAAQAGSGGVMVTHADNPIAWRFFKAPKNIFLSLANIPGDAVLGGYADSWNDILLARARTSYAGAQILVPVNLLVSRGGGSDGYFSPIGKPSGVRMVRMDGLDPGAQIDVGNKKWRVFPQIRKSESTSVSRGTYWNSTETSWMVGLAYLEGNA